MDYVILTSALMVASILTFTFKAQLATRPVRVTRKRH